MSTLVLADRIAQRSHTHTNIGQMWRMDASPLTESRLERIVSPSLLQVCTRPPSQPPGGLNFVVTGIFGDYVQDNVVVRAGRTTTLPAVIWIAESAGMHDSDILLH